jgi:hypothetical protein
MRLPTQCPHGHSAKSAEIQVIPDFVGERGGTRTLDPMIESHGRWLNLVEVSPFHAATILGLVGFDGFILSPYSSTAVTFGVRCGPQNKKESS